ncbi:hypothetical protein THF1D04_20544 [Vibrio owensii]|uniref:Uncharacterized protein n=1 Tax=Vibrio owensii TaxID=696485 RepID=A0AAU9Q576_9VIBR|nr:hypothetical protein THF1D04_20544 [Vibrio owensii]
MSLLLHFEIHCYIRAHYAEGKRKAHYPQMETNVPFMKAYIDIGIAKQVHNINALQRIFFSLQ